VLPVPPCFFCGADGFLLVSHAPVHQGLCPPPRFAGFVEELTSFLVSFPLLSFGNFSTSPGTDVCIFFEIFRLETRPGASTFLPGFCVFRWILPVHFPVLIQGVICPGSPMPTGGTPTHVHRPCFSSRFFPTTQTQSIPSVRSWPL